MMPERGRETVEVPAISNPSFPRLPKAEKSGSRIAWRISLSITTVHTAKAKTNAPAKIQPAERAMPLMAMNASERSPIQTRQAAATRMKIFDGRYEVLKNH